MSGSVGASEAQASGATRPRMLPLPQYASDLQAGAFLTWPEFIISSALRIVRET
jgi:hypothetical protein